MSVVIFSNQAGRVVAFTDPGLPAVTAVRLSNFGGFTATRSIITRVGFSGQCNVNFRHTIGGAVHLYTFGDRIGRAIVSGLCFDSGCDRNEFDGLAHIVNYYDRNRVSERGSPVRLTIGAALSLRAYLMAVNCDVAETTSRVYQFTFDLVLVPIPRRRTTTEDNRGAVGGVAGGAVASSPATGVEFSSTESPTFNYSFLPSLTPASVAGGDISGAPGGPVLIPLSASNGYSAGTEQVRTYNSPEGLPSAMINHARTLLMNVDGSAPYDIPGEELIPQDFRAVQLTRALMNVRRVLFGATPDRHMLNYRCKQFMHILHATDLARFVYALDSRISYSTTTDTFSPNILFGRKVIPQGTATKPLFVLGTHDPPDASGRMQSVWIVKVLDLDTAESALLSPSIVTSQDYMMVDGLSTEVALPGSDLQVRFAETTGAQWRIQSLVRPEKGPGQLLNNLRELPEENVVEVFQLTSEVTKEPYKTFYQLWEKHHELAYRLGAYLLAVIYSTDKLR